MVKELEGQKKHATFAPMHWGSVGSIKCSLEVTSSPVPCMISKGMANILLYICTDLLLPLLILTSKTLKFVPPRSRARYFPFSVREERYFILVLLVARFPVRMLYSARHLQETSPRSVTAHYSLWHLSHLYVRPGANGPAR